MTQPDSVPSIFTIGHSNIEQASFLHLLLDRSIDVVVDVRSAPYSKYVPQFNKREIEQAVQSQGMHYIFMGDLIGGMPTAPDLLDEEGRPDYLRIAAGDSFKQGIKRLKEGLDKGYRIVLMCAEEKPLACHRHLLIAKALEDVGISVYHWRHDGSTLRANDHFAQKADQLQLFNSASS